MARDALNQYNIFKVSSPMAISEVTARLSRSDSFMIPSGHDSLPEKLSLAKDCHEEDHRSIMHLQ